MIQGFFDNPTAFPGDAVTVRIATDAPQFRIDFYRQGATLDWRLSTDWSDGAGFPGEDHVPWDDWGKDGTRADQIRAAAGWNGLVFSVPNEWDSGVYIAMFVEGDGSDTPQAPLPDFSKADARQGKALLVVKNPAPGFASQVLYKVPLFTYQSYNNAGGNSIYQGVDVSLHRPGGGTGGTPWDAWNYDPWDKYAPSDQPPILGGSPRQVFQHWDAKLIAWLETQGYRLDYCTDWDIHQADAPALLASYAVVLSVGHDEYYSAPMREHLEGYVGAGGNVAFLSGNTCWWRTEFDDQDPFLMHGQQTIHHWSDLGVGQPEDALTGVSWRNGGEGNKDRAKIGYVLQNTDFWPFEGVGVSDGDEIGHEDGLVGYECDGTPYDKNTPRPVSPGFDPSDRTPPSFVILGTADLTSFEVQNGNFAATMGMYTQNGTVFTGATTDWPRVTASGDPRVAHITRNVIDRLGGNPKGLADLGQVGSSPYCCDGFFSSEDNFRHAVIGIGPHGMIKELRFSPVVGQQNGLTKFLEGLLDLGAFVSDDDQVRHIVAVDDSGNVWDLAGTDRLLVNIPNGSRVTGFYTADDQMRHAIVGTRDGDVVEVYYRGGGDPNPQTASLGSFQDLVDVGGFFSPDDNYRHAVVGTADGNITEIYFQPAFGIFQTVIANVPGLTVRTPEGVGPQSAVSAYYAADDQFFNRRVQVLTGGGRIHEIRYSPRGGVMRAVLLNTAGVVDIGAFYSGDDNYRHSILALPGGDVRELFFNP